MSIPENQPNYDMRDEQTQAWLRRILDEQMKQTQQLATIARAAQLYFWLTIIGLILGICGPLVVVVLGLTGIISGFPMY